MRAVVIAGRHSTHDEVIYPIHRLKEEGCEVDVAVRNVEKVLSDLGGKIIPTCDIPVGNLGRFDLLILPGGAKAMEYMRQDRGILDYIQTHHAMMKPIGCICHGTQLLISAGCVKGRRISGYYSIKDDINNAGGEFVDAPFVTDGHIVTSPHYRHLGAWMREVIRLVRESI